MSTANGTGIDYPTIDLGGKTYTIKYTRAAVYDLSKAGVNLQGKQIPFHQIVDAMHILIEFPGTQRELAELLHGRVQEAWDKMNIAAGKIMPPIVKLQEPAASEQRNPDQVQ